MKVGKTDEYWINIDRFTGTSS